MLTYLKGKFEFMRKFEGYIKNIRQQGKMHFTSAQAISELKISNGAFWKGIHKLKLKGDIISPAKF